MEGAFLLACKSGIFECMRLLAAAGCDINATDGQGRTAADIIKSHCSAVLPDFKQPSEIRIVDDIARNDRGKPDRNTMKNLWLSENGETA